VGQEEQNDRFRFDSDRGRARAGVGAGSGGGGQGGREGGSARVVAKPVSRFSRDYVCLSFL